MLNYTHPTITVLEPDPGHFVVRGHATPYSTEGGTVCPLEVCDIPPGVPSDLLVSILDARRGHSAPVGEVSEIDIERFRAELVRIAQKWSGHEGVNYKTTTTENLLLLIGDAVDGDHAKLPVVTEGQPQKNKGGRPRKTTEAAQ